MAIFESERINPNEYKASGEQWKQELQKSVNSALNRFGDMSLMVKLMQLRMMLEIHKRLETRQYNVDEALRR